MKRKYAISPPSSPTRRALHLALASAGVLCFQALARRGRRVGVVSPAGFGSVWVAGRPWLLRSWAAGRPEGYRSLHDLVRRRFHFAGSGSGRG